MTMVLSWIRRVITRVRTSRRLSLLAAAVLGAVLVVGAQVALKILRPASVSQTLAVVDGKPITLSAFQAEITRRGGEAAFAGAHQRRALLDELIRVEVLASNAVKAGASDDPDVKRAIDQLMADKYQHENIDAPLADLQVTDGEIEDYYRSNVASFSTPETAHAAVIFFAVPANASDDDKQALQQRVEHIHDLAVAKPGASNFADLAAQYSDDQDTRAQGGDIGWISEGQENPRWEPAVTKGVFDLDNPGQVSPVIATATGFYIVKLLEDQAAAVRPLPEVRNSIRQLLIRAERQHRAAKLYAAALANVQVSVNEAAVAAMEAAERAVVDLPHGSAPEPKG
jgi:parvulin-like peptidyl-prolyl isomerase